ncbi:MAG: Rieske (2Fe-2S) protein [Desulfobacterium sp.]|nr:Rieske (2Fe-2S) protein [Desulfobacterium sp.]
MFNHRQFLKVAGMVAGVLFAWPIRWVKAKPLGLKLDKVEKLKNVGRWAILKIKIKKKPVLFIRTSEDTIRALDPTCPHKKCQVQYNEKINQIVCPCHKSRFNPDGKYLDGPAKKDLTAYKAYLRKNMIVIDLDKDH